MSDETWEEIVDQPLPRYAKEIPIVGRTWMLEGSEPVMPETDLQALMEAAPNAPPAISKEAQKFQNETITHHFEQLSDEEKAVIEVTVYGGHSIRAAAELLGWPKTTVHRIKESALERLRRLMEMEMEMEMEMDDGA